MVSGVQRAYRFRLYPSRAQEEAMLLVLELCRWLYNFFLGMIRCCVKVPKKTWLQEMLPALCRKHPKLNMVHSKTRQYVLYQLYSNLKALSKLKKNGRKVGSLRFKGRGWYKTFMYNQSGFKLKCGSKQKRQMGILHLSKIGDIPMRLHRNFTGDVKQVIVKHSGSGKWYATLIVENDQPINTTPAFRGKSVGIDVGIINYARDSGGKATEHPHNIDKSSKRLRREQRRLARKQYDKKTKRSSKNREKQRVKVSRVYERIVNQRNDFLHKLSRYYVNRYDYIFVEKLNIQGLMRGIHNARNMADAAWGRFFNMLEYKAESACSLVVKVPAKNTSQECSGCGKMVPKTLAVRQHKCPYCGLDITRDGNSSIVILHRGMRIVGLEESESTPVETEPLHAIGGQASSVKQELPQGASVEAPSVRVG